jgi:hypothetical protein
MHAQTDATIDFIYKIGHLIQGSFSKDFQLTFGPFSTMCDPCAPMCGPCPFMWELIVNYDLIKNERKVN